MKKILIISCHPYEKSFSNALADAYEKGAKKGNAEIKRINLRDLNFDPILHAGYHKIQELEPDLKMAQDYIKWAEHIIFVFPTWWMGLPALFKGFIDRVFLPGFGFKYRKNSPFWDKLLKGRSARLIITMDSPKFYNWITYRNEGHINFRKGVLEFCGIKPIKKTIFHRIVVSDENKRKKWLEKVENLGKKEAR